MHLYTAVLFPDLTHIATTTSEMCTEYDIDILQVSFTHFTESFYIKFWNKAQGTPHSHSDKMSIFNRP